MENFHRLFQSERLGKERLALYFTKYTWMYLKLELGTLLNLLYMYMKTVIFVLWARGLITLTKDIVLYFTLC